MIFMLRGFPFLKMDAWNMIVSFWGPYFHGQKLPLLCREASYIPLGPPFAARSSHFGSRRCLGQAIWNGSQQQPQPGSLGDWRSPSNQPVVKTWGWRPSSDVDFWICFPKVWWRQLHGSRSTRECAFGIFLGERENFSPHRLKGGWKVRDFFLNIHLI